MLVIFNDTWPFLHLNGTREASDSDINLSGLFWQQLQIVVQLLRPVVLLLKHRALNLHTWWFFHFPFQITLGDELMEGWMSKCYRFKPNNGLYVWNTLILLANVNESTSNISILGVHKVYFKATKLDRFPDKEGSRFLTVMISVV